MTIEPYAHRCIVQTGDLAGNKHSSDVPACAIEYSMNCDNCGEPLATVEQIVAHIYEQLTERS